MVTFVVLRLVAVFLLVAANAFFVAAEFALVSVRETRIQQLIAAHRVGARTLQKLHKRLDEFISAVQFGVTVTSLALGWVGEAAMAKVLEPLFIPLPHSHVYAHIVAVIFAFILITYLHVILGEVVPKSIALQRTERVALAVAGPMDFFMTVAAPLLAIMTASTHAVLKAFGMRQVREGGVHSPEELKLIVTASRNIGVIEQPQEELIHRALELENVLVREIMVPRRDISSLPGDMTLYEALEQVVDEEHSRVPVYDPERGPEHIIGVLYAKDLMRWMRYRLSRTPSGRIITRESNLRVRHIMREVLVVPETKALPDLLVDFKARKRHLAVVVDEFGSTVGIVTVEDVLEQLVGEIEDEFDISEPTFAPGATSMEFDGSVNIRDLEQQYHIGLPRDEGFETLGGFVLAKLQRIPQVDDSFEHEGRRYTVTAMDGLRVERVKIDLPQPAESAQGVGAGHSPEALPANDSKARAQPTSSATRAAS